MSQGALVGLRPTAHGVQGIVSTSGGESDYSDFSASAFLSQLFGIEERGARSEERFALSPSGRGIKGERAIAGQAASLKDKFNSLSLQQQEQIRKNWGSHLEELFSLSRETDPELFYEAIFHLGNRLEKSDRLELASLVYSLLAAPPHPCPSPQGERVKEAQERLDAMNGAGSPALRLEFLFPRIPKHALDPAALAGMGLGGMGYRLVRNRVLGGLLFGGGKGIFNAGIPAKGLAALTGITAEAPTFMAAGTGVNALLGREQDLSLEALGKGTAGLGIVLGSMRLVGWGFALPRVESPWSRAAFQEGGMLGGIMLGHYAEGKIGLTKTPDGATVLTDSLSTLFTIHIAGATTRNAFGQKFNAFERRLDAQAKRMREGENGGKGEWFNRLFPSSLLPPFPPSPILRFSPAGPPFPMEATPSVKPIRMSPHWDGISTTRARKIEEVFLPYFTSPESGPFGKLVWESIMSIDCELPLFHERMLQAFLHFDPIPGTKEQVWRADAIKEVFQAKALSTSTASFDYALIEALFRKIIVDPDMNQRLAASRMMFRSMERGLNRAKVLDIFRTFGYGKDYRIPHRPIYDDEFWQDHLDLIVEHWQEYPSDGLPQLFNYIYLASAGDSKRADRIIEIFGKGRSSGKYSREDITNALDYSANSPVGRIVLTRMLHIFATEDISGKLREIPRERADTDTFEFMNRVGTLNLPRLIQQINNTIHTGYLDDPILARKVAEIMLQTRPFVENPELREQNKDRLDEVFWKLIKPKEGLDPKIEEEEFQKRIHDPDELLKFLELNEGPDWEVREALNPKNPTLRIKFESETTLGTDKALFRSAKNEGEIDELWILKMPSADRSTEEGQKTLYNPWLGRAKSLRHEITHWKHQGTHLLNPPLNREKRLASEIMANMEDTGWELRNFGTETYERAKRLGQPLGFYLRDLNDVGYFGESNRMVARGIFGENQ